MFLLELENKNMSRILTTKGFFHGIGLTTNDKNFPVKNFIWQSFLLDYVILKPGTC